MAETEFKSSPATNFIDSKPLSSGALHYSTTPADPDATTETKTYAYPNRYGDCLAIVIDSMALAARREYIFNCPDKHVYSSLVLVCRRWAYILRPLIFRRLILWTMADVAFLTEMLQSPVSGWLRECVVTIMLEDRTEADPPLFAGPAWLPLLDETPALKALCLGIRLTTRTYQPAVWDARALREHSVTRTLRHLALSNVQFHSLGDLCSLVSSFDSLRGLYLERALWNIPEMDPACKDENKLLGILMPRCKAGFPGLEMVCVEQCTETRAFAWLLAAASLRYEYTMEGGDAADIPGDLLSIVKMVFLIFDTTDWNIVARRVLDEKDTYAFSMQIAVDQDTPSSRNHSNVTFVTRPSPSASTPNAKWTLQHIVVACAHEPITYTQNPTFNLESTMKQFLGYADDVAGAFQDLQTIEVLYCAPLVEPQDFAYAKDAVRKLMPKVGSKVRFTPYDLAKGPTRLELADGDIVLEPFKGWWKSEWIYEL